MSVVLNIIRHAGPSGALCILAYSASSRFSTLAGLPAAKLLQGIGFVTTLPAPTTEPEPIVTPPRMMTRMANQTSSPMVIVPPPVL